MKQPIDDPLMPGDLVQISPEHTGNKAFAGCIMVVTEPKYFGAMGYVQTVGARNSMGSQCFYRVNFSEIERVGHIAWWVNYGHV